MKLKDFVKVADMTMPIKIEEKDGNGELYEFYDLKNTPYYKDHADDEITFISYTDFDGIGDYKGECILLYTVQNKGERK